MSRPLPVRFNPFKLAEQSQSLMGSVSLAGMKRLAEVLVDTDGEAQCELALSRPAIREYRLHLSVKASLPLICQRCLEVYQEEVSSESVLVLVHSDSEAERVAEDLEPYVVENEVLDVSAVVEEELLLSLPPIPRHPEGQSCKVKILHEFDDEEAEAAGEVGEKKPNPFAVLGDLKDH